MRDAHQLQERGVAFWRSHTAWFTVSAIALIAGIFALGFGVGRRTARLENSTPEASDPLGQLDAERQLHDKLTFYSQLTAAPPPVAAAPKAIAPLHDAAAGNTSLAPTNKPESLSEPAINRSRGPAQPGEYTVQVSSFQTPHEAKAFASSLERQGFHPYIVQAALADKGTWYRVRVGRFNDEAQAQGAKSILARADIPAWVLRAD